MDADTSSRGYRRGNGYWTVPSPEPRRGIHGGPHAPPEDLCGWVLGRVLSPALVW